ncbi:PREDICTED: uncharacterized protein LOC108686379 isoform X2 [Atta colombica]|uniref:uncharacterized protein LOC108686379 isoform X2 n=1 Tax=Atta colombica TaxID=520822 RepID=UPI00084BFD47|nr:PREDICTED: uncharacterized protein LOC108686379 isoform X2 [Atta colombica]
MMKKISEQVDSSSSEDEKFANILKEAIDQQFLNNNLYSIEKAEAITQSAKTDKLEGSYFLKISSKQADEFTNFGVTVTFQNFIAKKLDEILERTIEIENGEILNYCDEQKWKKDKSSGIKLLSTSKNLLTITKIKEECTGHKKKSKRNRQTVEDDETSSKFREAAIDPEYILNKLDLEAWVNKRPESEFKYKRLKDGTLIEM